MDASNRRGVAGSGKGRKMEISTSAGVNKPSSLAEERTRKLRRSLEEEVIPRLVQAHRSRQNSVAASDLSPALTQQQLLDFAELVLGGEHQAVIAFVEALRAHGLSVDAICLSLLAPTARHLGKLWDADLCDFTRVTLGLSRLQQILRCFPLDTAADSDSGKRKDRVLLLPASGEQHSFGLAIVAEFLMRAGWDVTGGSSAIDMDLPKLVEREFFDIVGLSIGCRHHIDAVTTEIASIRGASRNPDVRIMVGGPILTEHPEFARIVNSDTYAIDAQDAVVQARKLLDVLRRSK